MRPDLMGAPGFQPHSQQGVASPAFQGLPVGNRPLAAAALALDFAPLFQPNGHVYGAPPGKGSLAQGKIRFFQRRPRHSQGVFPQGDSAAGVPVQPV